MLMCPNHNNPTPQCIGDPLQFYNSVHSEPLKISHLGYILDGIGVEVEPPDGVLIVDHLLGELH